VNQKNLMLAAAAGSGLAQLGLSRTDALVSLIVFVMIVSLTIAGPVACCLLPGETAKARLDEKKDWLAVDNAVMAVQFLVLGAKLIADGVPPVT
jgi:threonine/homoserine/homoserine lactone efflux protein